MLRTPLTREQINYLKSQIDAAVRKKQLDSLGRKINARGEGESSEAHRKAVAKYDAKRRNGGVSEAEKARKRRFYQRHKERLRQEFHDRKNKTPGN